MVRTWALLVVGFAILSAVGLTTTIPVGVTAADVREEVEALRAANDDTSLEAAVAAATEYLQETQRRRIRFLFLAYIAIWTILGGYTLTLARRQARLRDAIDGMDPDRELS